MDKMAFYRKYRPNNFESLVGQDYIKTTLINALTTNHVSHAYLFAGPRGTGKTSTARLIAKALNCSNLKDGYEPCDKCELCIDVNEGRLIDMIEIDAASNRGIDEVRDLKEKINFAPTRANCKVYIIDEVHMMTKEAFNALLKTLEEPPSHAYFILATTEIHKIPETIISRCQRFDFRRINEKALLARLDYIAKTENIDAEIKALEVISRYSDGGLRDAIGLLEQLSANGKLMYSIVHDVLGMSAVSLLDDLFNALIDKKTKDAIKIIHDLHDQGSDLKKFSHEFIERLRSKLLEAINKDEQKLVAILINMIEIFQDAKLKLQAVDIPQLPLEIAVIKISGPNYKLEEEIEAPVKAQQQVVTPKVEKIEKVEVFENLADGSKLTLLQVKEKWPRITERITSPSLKMSLKNAVPMKVELKDVTLQFDTNFHMEKVMEANHRVELEAAIKEVIGHGTRVLSFVKALEIKSVVDEEVESYAPPLPPEPAQVKSQKESSSSNMIDEALNIFGGEVV